MAAPKRTEFEAERDRELIARLYLRGKSQQAITDDLNTQYYQNNPISRHQISYDIRLIIERWERSAVNHIEQRKAQELAKLNEIEAAAWDGFERSLQNKEETIKGTTPKGHQDITKIVGQAGDPRYLDIALKCVDKRCQILGLDAPTKIAPTDPTGQKEYSGAMSDEERAARIAAILSQVQQRQTNG